MTSASHPSNHWYLDVRHAETTEQISLDLTRHLPRRLSIGPVVVVTEAPLILLPVVRKRWMKIIREVETHRSSTIDRTKRRAFETEIQRMRSFVFTTKIHHPHPDVLVITPTQTVCELPIYTTLYVISPLTEGQLSSVLAHAAPKSAIVVYDTSAQYDKMLTNIIKHTKNY